MTILNELLEEIQSSERDEQVKILCDSIFEEEKKTIKHPPLLPMGPNIFLSLEVPGRRKAEICYVSLERDMDKFIATVRVVKKSDYDEWIINRERRDPLPTLSKIRAVPINEDKPKKILREYAKVIKFMRGE